jgi:hypothetical protein
MTNKTKTKIILGVMLISGLVFAAYTTKFYGDIDMQNHKITNVATPTANADATTKAYVDTQVSSATITKLNLSGGTMTGDINMNGKRIYGLPTPNRPYDTATKSYVDTAIQGVSGGYQYFAMKEGSNYIPLKNFWTTTTSNYWLKFVVVKQFNGEPSVSAENMDCTVNVSNPTNKTWKVGESFNVKISPSTATINTNGTIIVNAGSGVFGNFGITFPKTANLSFMFIAYTNGTEVVGDTRADRTPFNIKPYSTAVGTSDLSIQMCCISNTSPVSVNGMLQAYAWDYSQNTSYTIGVGTNLSEIIPSTSNFMFSLNPNQAVYFNVYVMGYNALVDYGVSIQFNLNILGEPTTYFSPLYYQPVF